MSAALPARDDTVSSPDAISPSSNPAAAASRTVVPTHFPHQPLAAAPVHAFLDTALPPLNVAPLELDSTPVVSPTVVAPIGGIAARRPSWKARAAGQQGAAAPEKGGGEDGVEDLEKARLKADDPAVLNGPLDTPNADDFKAALVGVETRDVPVER
jgi:hypothetical protein